MDAGLKSNESGLGRCSQVRGASVERFVSMMELDQDEALAETYRWLDRRGVGVGAAAGRMPNRVMSCGSVEARIKWEWER